MREEYGQIIGDLTINEDFTLWGSIAGNVRAVKGSKFYVRGVIYGDLSAEPDARVHVFGNISGNLTVMERAKVIHSGVLGGDAVNHGGRLYIDATARVLGKIFSQPGVGQTTVEKPRA